MDAHKRRAWICTLTGGVVAATLLWFWWRRERPIEPAGPNPFVSEFVFERLDNGTAIGETVELAVNSGFYARMALRPDAAPPELLDGRSVVESQDWPLALVLYPRHSSPDADDALCVPCGGLEAADRRHRPRSRNVRVSIPIGNPAVWSASGYDGPPELPEGFGTEDELRLWTYFAVRKNQPGEYVYELTLYPTAAWESSVRFEKGQAVVLQRGLLKVIGDSA